MGAIIKHVLPILCVLSLSSVSALTVLPANQTIESTQSKDSLLPLVDINKQENKSQVDVHVPIFFDMTNNNDAESGRAKLDLSVLSGLITVSRDKTRQPDGRLTGPLVVTVFGIPVYSGRGVRKDLTTGNSNDPISSRLLDKMSVTSNQLYSNLKIASERSLSSFSNYLRNLAEAVKPKHKGNTVGPEDKIIDNTIPASNMTKVNVEANVQGSIANVNV